MKFHISGYVLTSFSTALVCLKFSINNGHFALRTKFISAFASGTMCKEYTTSIKELKYYTKLKIR